MYSLGQLRFVEVLTEKKNRLIYCYQKSILALFFSGNRVVMAQDFQVL